MTLHDVNRLFIHLPSPPDDNGTITFMEQTLSGNSAISMRETQIEMNIDWKATNNNKLFSISRLHMEADGKGTLRATICTIFSRCPEPLNVCHSITTRNTSGRQMKVTLFTRHCKTVEPMMFEIDWKATLWALHTDTVNKAVKSHERNVVLDDLPPSINNS